ncbi:MULTISPECIES: glycosyltransferase family 4 protein [unclassified Bradyrhizobium]|uniref:glycosyltransferase family 4 protein n=1 Tax=unclassified Bradyrhizobium TaxID=2631580 RepID=UPI001FFA2A95|nr:MULTISPECIES: glycosyltransferase family 4 protein [unclassified Bradyrhizobium]MCK1317385.1 glycosyltransferase family 4 protein [Bradyrhizobium sp. 23]MCK1510683.1 glycosyltransferase family 4 protein [Bradyrhizobium sp. 18]MCK1630702.1 glycosyltransferase family 4 protein [Bradyrhizobium sp. 162]MCK1694399.1 glycosyltransferase family 4 protein [Bradyrhizobium sp. 144]
MPNRRFIVVIGQIPPPMDGLAYITSEYVKLLSEDHDVRVLDISPKATKRGVAYHLSRTVTVLRASLHLIYNASRENRLCYMPCQSDFGLVYTIQLLALARLLGYPTYLHHHNFGYINERRRMMQVALQAGGPKVVHIFLCERMQERFSQTYWKPATSVVISNAAFVSPQANQTINSPGTPLKIGLLSNLNREKGLYLFLDLLRAARDQGLSLQGTLAGPVRDPDDRSALDAAERELGERLHYVGPLYGDEKTSFYESIDVFAFPTTYVNEAQPTVIYEALAAGNLILTYERGCIPSQVRDNGLVISQDLPFIPHALSWLQNLSERKCASGRASVADRASELHRAERARARTLFTPGALDG